MSRGFLPSRMLTVIFAVLSCLFFVGQVDAQFKAYFEANDAAFCASVFKVGYAPYLGTNTCLADIHNGESASSIMYAVSFVSEPLKEPLARFLCAYAYPPAAGVLPCQSFCEDVNNGMKTNTADKVILSELSFEGKTFLQIFEQCNVFVQHNCAGSSANFDDIFRPSPLVFPENRCEPYQGTICQGLFENVFLPAQYSQEFLEAQIKQASLFLPLAPTTDECVTHFARYICSRVFWPCHTHTYSTVAAPPTSVQILLPQMPDRKVCLQYNDKCGGFIANMNNILGGNILTGLCESFSPINEKRNCKNETSIVGLASFPVDKYDLALGPIQIEVRTHMFSRQSFTSAVSSEYSGTPIVSCPAPLVLPDDPNTPNRVSEASCATPCPSLFFTDSEYRTADYLVTIMSAIGTVCSLFMLVTWLCFEEKRKSIYVISFLSMGFLLSLSFLISSIAYFSGDLGNPIAKHYCASNSEEISVEHGGWCVGQAFLIQFSVLSLSAWWSVSALDLWIKIVGNQRYAPGSREDLIQKSIYHFWGWGIPLILTLVSLGTNSLGAGDLSTAFCFAHQRNNKVVSWATAYYPLGVYLILGGGSMIWTIIVLVRSTRAVGSRSWKPYFGAISFVSIFVVIFVIILTYRVIAYANESNWRYSATSFVTCLLVNNPLQGVDCGSRPADRPNAFLWYFTQFILSGFGFHSFMVYTFSKDNYLLWAARIGRWFNIEKCRKWGANTTEGMKYASQRTSGHTSHSGTGSTKGTAASSDGRSSGASHKPGATARFNTFRFQNKTGPGGSNGSGASGWNNSSAGPNQGSSASGSAAHGGSSFQGDVPSAARTMEAAQDYERPTDDNFTTDGAPGAIEMTTYNHQPRGDVEGVAQGTVSTYDNENDDAHPPPPPPPVPAVPAVPPPVDDDAPLETDD